MTDLELAAKYWANELVLPIDIHARLAAMGFDVSELERSFRESTHAQEQPLHG